MRFKHLGDWKTLKTALDMPAGRPFITAQRRDDRNIARPFNPPLLKYYAFSVISLSIAVNNNF